MELSCNHTTLFFTLKIPTIKTSIIMKNVFLLLSFLLISSSLFAQEGMKIGIGFGPAITFARTETSGVLTTKESGLGSRLSLTGRYGFSENYGLQTGIALTTKAYGEEESMVGKVKISTLEIPLGLALRTNEISDGVYVTGFVGPTIDVNISSKLKLNGVESDNNSTIKPIGSSIRFGLGTEKEFDFGTVNVGISYSRGLTNIAKDQPNVTTKVHYIAFEGMFFF